LPSLEDVLSSFAQKKAAQAKQPIAFVIAEKKGVAT